ncbi:MAG TPA: sigma-70 family RNA polymerase sigma factor [Candidatus Baltobacteraceae bacterium]|jgi:RNA polymerase sigma factor (sigma-70 family)|nr:sigma-70 family RNA polymerase sigma factor [Candidatus Baltobacteraceae bacterium]
MDESDSVRESQVRALFPLVKSIARRVRRMVPGSDLDDLIGEGCVGLIRAVDTFDGERGPSLERYASRIIAGAMLNGVRRMDPVSERVRREIREAERERYDLATQLGALPSVQEMESRRPALRRATVHAYRQAPLSLDNALPTGESFTEDWSTDPVSIVIQLSEQQTVHAAMQSLAARQRYVVHSHYFTGQSLHQISRSLKISPQRASQLHQAALRKLRNHINGAD